MKFLTSYYHNGAQWSLVIDADDWADAEARCRKLGLQLDGEYVATIPAQCGWLARAWVWMANALR